MLLQQKKCIERIYTTTAPTFPLGIKMRLVPEIQEVTNPETLAKVVQLHALQERFLASTETRRIYEGECAMDHHTPNLVDTLRAMTISSWQANKQAQPLFHAISPMVTKGGYLVRYLPQHRIKARAALAPFVQCHPAGPERPIATTPAMDRQIQPVNHPASLGHPQDNLDKLFRLQFIVPFGLGPASKSPKLCMHASRLNLRIPTPSTYQLLRWLRALGQLFQNIAWDRWRYQLGILLDLQVSCNEN